MTKSLIKKDDKRVIFSSGKQQQFLLMARENLGLSWSLFADKIRVHERTLNDWRREKYSMPFGVFKRICRTSSLKVPVDIEVRQPFWSTREAGRVGGRSVYQKYGSIGGDPEYRKKRWHEWWNREGKYKTQFFTAPKSIQKPRFSGNLAEFVGIILGDGGISEYQVVITLHRRDDREYSEFVVSLIKELFNVHVGIYYRKNDLSVNFVVSRIELVRFCIDKLGLKRGDKIKQQVDIPNWIKQNRLYSIACVRGLIDTDGCIFTHSYKVNGKLYNYKKLSFTSYSKFLRQSVFDILKDNGLKPRLSQDRDVRLDSIADIKRYFQLIGSHNSKHLKRLKN